MNDTTTEALRSECSQELAAGIQQAKEAARFNWGEMVARRVRIREDIEFMVRHPEPCDRQSLVIALTALGFELDDFRGYPAISLKLTNPLLEVMNVGALITQYHPRMYEAISQSVRHDPVAQLMWFEVERSEEEVCS